MAGDFRYGESARVPGEVSIPNRNYMNLLELPVLFYAICVINYIASPTVSALTLLIAIALWQLYSLTWGDRYGGSSTAGRSAPLGSAPVPAVINNSTP